MSDRRFPPLPGETPQEWSARVLAAHADLDRAAEERRIARQAARQVARSRIRCPYCSSPKRVGRLTCAKHVDLPKRDPLFNRISGREAEPIEDFRPEALPDRLLTKAG